jgi:dihydroorotate dehydrogenase
MNPYALLLRPLLFQLDPERAHDLTWRMVILLEEILARRRHPRPMCAQPALSQQLWGLTFSNPVGLAAGFDKDARAPHVWQALGFGFAELGTITAQAQPGNLRPRLFRLVRDRAVINRFGFNNSGATLVAERLAGLERYTRPLIPIGINIGKSRATPLDEAPQDYAQSVRALFPFASYFVVNVSSPNTPGLRDLQNPAALSELLAVLREENRRRAAERGLPPRPLLVKVAPDLDDADLARVVDAAMAQGAAGLVATNTTVSREGLREPSTQSGGLSGLPLRARATAVVRTLHRLAGPQLPIIGVGGIFSARDAYEKIRAGASLVQIYTGLLYEGPWLARRISRGLVALLQRDGCRHVRDAVGVDAADVGQHGEAPA